MDLPSSIFSSKSVNTAKTYGSENIKILLSQGKQDNITVFDLGHTMQVRFDDGSLVVWDNQGDSKAYYLTQYHVHAPSEHTIDGKNYEVEVHMVHKSYSDNSLAIVGIFFDSEKGGSQQSDFISALRADRLLLQNIT